MSGVRLQQAQQARLDERLDRIEEITRLTFESINGLIHPFSKVLKKIKIRGNVAVRPILVLGPVDREYEITFLLLAEERDRVLVPSDAAVAAVANQRLQEVIANPLRRRQRYERH